MSKPKPERLTQREIKVIEQMADIAENQPALDDEGNGDGDYTGWTSADFDAAETAARKLTRANLINAELLEALDATTEALGLFYDNTEEKHDSTMKRVGQALARGQRALAKAKEASTL